MSADCGLNGKDTGVFVEEERKGGRYRVGKSRGTAGSAQNTDFIPGLAFIKYCIIYLTVLLLLLSPVFGNREDRGSSHWEEGRS